MTEFYDWVRQTLNRGNTLDSVIPFYIKAAVREIENKWDFQQLEWWSATDLDPSCEPIFPLPGRLKSVRFLRYDVAGGEPRDWRYLERAKPEHMLNRTSDWPRKYWLKNRDYFVLDAQLATATRRFELSCYLYSDFPDEADGNQHHWLVDAIPLGLHAKVMLGLAGYMREDNTAMMQNWQRLASEAVYDLIREDQYVQEDTVSAQMDFWPEHIPHHLAYKE